MPTGRTPRPYLPDRMGPFRSADLAARHQEKGDPSHQVEGLSQEGAIARAKLLVAIEGIRAAQDGGVPYCPTSDDEK